MQVARPLVALLAAALVPLAACSDDEPTSHPTPSPSMSSSPTESESPDPQPESAEAFIRRWVAADTKMKNTADAHEYLSLSPDCAPCRRLVKLVQSFYRDGGFVDTGGWDVISVQEAPSTQQRRPTFIVNVHSNPTRYRESGSGPVKTLPGGPGEYRVSLVHHDGSWQVTDYIEVSQ
jgi:hypothetical protein